jgi:hypothetical protein
MKVGSAGLFIIEIFNLSDSRVKNIRIIRETFVKRRE